MYSTGCVALFYLFQLEVLESESESDVISFWHRLVVKGTYSLI